MDAVNRIRAVKTGSKGPFTDWPMGDITIEQAYIKSSASE